MKIRNLPLSERLTLYQKALSLREAGLGPRSISRKLGVSESTISQWIYGRTMPRIHKIGSVEGRGLNEVEKAYVAAAVDCEGTVGLYKHKRGSSLQWEPCLAISNTNLDFIRQLQRICDAGKIHFRIVAEVYEVQKAAIKRGIFELRFSANEIRKILPQIIPYMVVKRRQAELLIHALELIAEKDNNRLEEIYRRISFLNRLSRGGRRAGK